MDIGDPPVQGIFNRNQAEIDRAVPYRGKRVFESRGRNGLAMRQRLSRGKMGIGSRLALKRHPPGFFNQCNVAH